MMPAAPDHQPGGCHERDAIGEVHREPVASRAARRAPAGMLPGSRAAGSDPAA